MLTSNLAETLGNGWNREAIMSGHEPERILVVDDNSLFRETLVQRLRDAGYDVISTNTGERAFLALRDWSHPVGWLYTRANLPGLVDGWILADEYHDRHPDRPVIVAAAEARSSRRGDLILKQPTLSSVLETVRNAIEADRSKVAAARTTEENQRYAA
jgi:DNA-binding NtrC family response regulator